jgi:hypothetical protein
VKRKEMNGYKKKIVAIVVACTVVAAAVGVPIAFGDDTGAATQAQVEGIPPVVESITISPDDHGGTPYSVEIDPNEFTAGNKPVTITALVYCANGVDQVDTVSATIDPDITGVVEPIAMTMLAGDPGLHKKNYEGTFELTPCQAEGLYTVTVTATHKKDGVDPGSKAEDFTVMALMAMSTTDVTFGIAEIEPGASAAGTAEVTCQGNTAIEFTDASKITCSELTSTDNPANVIPADNIALDTNTYSWGTDILCGATDEISFDVTIPLGTAAETYTGTITFTPSEAV